MKAYWLLLVSLAIWTARQGGPERSPQGDPLEPLAAIAKELDVGFARWLTGRSAADAFPFLLPWPTGADLTELRSGLGRDRVTRVRSVSTEFELVLRRDGQSVYYLRTGITLDARPAFTMFEGRSISATAPLQVTAYPLGRYMGAGAAFARAAANVVRTLSSGNCSGLRLADRTELVSGLPADAGADLESRLASARRELPPLCALVNRLDPTDAHLRLDDVAHAALTAEGRATGVIRSQFALAPAGGLQFGIVAYRPFSR